MNAVDIIRGLTAWFGERLGSVPSVTLAEPIPLAGGAVASCHRLAATARIPDREVRASFVLKRPPSWSAEAHALRLLRAVQLPPERVPELVAAGEDGAGSWLLLTYHEGVNPPSNALPLQVLETLAQIHCHYAGRTSDLAILPQLDFQWWKQYLSDVVMTALDVAGATSSRSEAIQRLHAAARRWAADPRIAEALDVLPRTLVHGDMHLGNIIVGDQGASIIDWGNARAGPAHVDLDNIVSRDEAGSYARVRLRFGAKTTDIWLEDVGWAWATVQVQAQYITWPLSHGRIDECLHMVAKAERALRTLEIALARPRQP
jgi:aminoglycoside phosphotransferase (APT) family kinase protein